MANFPIRDTPQDQFNRLLQNLNQFMMNKNLIQQRSQGYEDVARVRGEEARLTDDRQFLNDMKVLKEEFYQKVSEMNPIDSLRTEIQYKRQAGQPTDDLETELHGHIANLAKGIVGPLQGELDAERVGLIAGELTEDSFKTIMQEAATSYRREQQISRVEEPGLDIERGKLAMRGQEHQLNVEELKQKQREWITDLQQLEREDRDKAIDEYLNMVRNAKAWLRQQGIKKGDAIPTSIRNFINVSDGLNRNPYSKEMQGKAYYALNNIESSLAQGNLPTPEQTEFLVRVQSPAQFQSGDFTMPSIEQTQGSMSPKANEIKAALDRWLMDTFGPERLKNMALETLEAWKLGVFEKLWNDIQASKDNPPTMPSPRTKGQRYEKTMKEK